MEASISTMNPTQTTRTDLDQPQLPYATGQPKSPQKVGMAKGGGSQPGESQTGESQTGDGERESQMCWAQELSYKNTTLDSTSPWAQSWRRHDIHGGEVFYHPQVSLIVELRTIRSYETVGYPSRRRHCLVSSIGCPRHL